MKALESILHTNDLKKKCKLLKAGLQELLIQTLIENRTETQNIEISLAIAARLEVQNDENENALQNHDIDDVDSDSGEIDDADDYEVDDDIIIG